MDLPARPPLIDAQGRRITYLRLSVTDRCNFRCVYCSPANWAGKTHGLSAEALVRIARLFVSAGVDRVRLTGGEPLLRDDLVDIAREIRRLGVRELCLTTNGHHLSRDAHALVEAGVTHLNLSIDTTDERVFRTLTERGEVSRVVDGLRAASTAGFRHLSVNAVVIAGRNDSSTQLSELARTSWDHGATPRFIELMPFAGGDAVVPNTEARRRLAEVGIELTPVGARSDAGPASYFRTADGREVGFIGAMTENFCTRCNRVRVSAAGELRACLGGRDQVELAPLLASNAGDEEILAVVRAALAAKHDGHRFVEERGRGLFPMMSFGG